MAFRAETCRQFFWAKRIKWFFRRKGAHHSSSCVSFNKPLRSTATICVCCHARNNVWCVINAINFSLSLASNQLGFLLVHKSYAWTILPGNAPAHSALKNPSWTL
jgi:hypothetical protein